MSVGSKKFGVGSLKRFEKQGGGEHTIVQIIENVFKKKPACKSNGMWGKIFNQSRYLHVSCQILHNFFKHEFYSMLLDVDLFFSANSFSKFFFSANITANIRDLLCIFSKM